MRSSIFFIFLLLCSCASETEVAKEKFSTEKWTHEEEGTFPYRITMYQEVLYHDTIRNGNQDQILSLLGKPDRQQEGHWYYQVNQEKMGEMPLHTRTLVIKWEADTITWIKVHQ